MYCSAGSEIMVGFLHDQVSPLKTERSLASHFAARKQLVSRKTSRPPAAEEQRESCMQVKAMQHIDRRMEYMHSLANLAGQIVFLLRPSEHDQLMRKSQVTSHAGRFMLCSDPHRDMCRWAHHRRIGVMNSSTVPIFRSHIFMCTQSSDSASLFAAAIRCFCR